MKRRIVAFPDNLDVKAEVVKARLSITEVAEAINKSREWVNKVLNGHEPGTEAIQLIRDLLKERASN